MDDIKITTSFLFFSMKNPNVSKIFLITAESADAPLWFHSKTLQEFNEEKRGGGLDVGYKSFCVGGQVMFEPNRPVPKTPEDYVNPYASSSRHPPKGHHHSVTTSAAAPASSVAGTTSARTGLGEDKGKGSEEEEEEEGGARVAVTARDIARTRRSARGEGGDSGNRVMTSSVDQLKQQLQPLAAVLSEGRGTGGNGDSSSSSSSISSSRGRGGNAEGSRSQRGDFTTPSSFQLHNPQATSSRSARLVSARKW